MADTMQDLIRLAVKRGPGAISMGIRLWELEERLIQRARTITCGKRGDGLYWQLSDERPRPIMLWQERRKTTW